MVELEDGSMIPWPARLDEAQARSGVVKSRGLA